MALQLLPQSKVNGIINNFRLIFKTGDITKMNKSGYKYIYLASGFIAHYNMYGFIETYGDALTLAKDIIRNTQANKWLNFSASDTDYEYMKQKAYIYSKISEFAKDYFIQERNRVILDSIDDTSNDW